MLRFIEKYRELLIMEYDYEFLYDDMENWLVLS